MSDYTQKIIKIISERTGLDISEISEESFFEDDLNISQLELVDILTELEDVFHVDLVSEKGTIETVQDLVDLISEQVE